MKEHDRDGILQNSEEDWSPLSLHGSGSGISNKVKGM